MRNFENENKISVIEFPSDQETVKHLQEKLQEYKQRLLDKKKKLTPYMAPEVVFNKLADTQYKIAVCETLLLEGGVDVKKLAQELSNRDAYYDPGLFDNAIRVIDDYIKTSGQSVMASTGFGSTLARNNRDKVDELIKEDSSMVVE